MALFKANETPKNKEPMQMYGYLFEVKNGEFIAEVPDNEAKQMASFGWGTINKAKDSPKKKGE